MNSERPDVSIIVTARNYGRFLKECLTSCVAQSYDACEVIYSDDGSKDDSLAIARSIEGVRVIAHRHEGVCAARNRGVRASRGDVLIHVDGDDQLTTDFVEKHLAALRTDTPFASGPAQAFGLCTNRWEVPEPGEKCIWEMNFANTSSAIWRWAFEAAGGWRENPSGTMWDWDLFLRASRFGPHARSDATLLYRQHGESWSHTHEQEQAWESRVGILVMVRRHLARLAIGCVYSGRLPGLLPKWLRALADSVKAANLPHAPELVFIDNSGTGNLEAISSRYQDVFSSVRIIPLRRELTWETEQERQSAVAGLLAEAYNMILDETTGELLLTVEDDITLPKRAVGELWHDVTEGYPLKAASAGCYQNRHTGEGWVSGWLKDGKPEQIDGKLPRDPFPVDLTGTGCLMFWRDLCPPRFDSHLGEAAAHDWQFSAAIRGSGREIRMLPAVRCRHYKSEKEWV